MTNKRRTKANTGRTNKAVWLPDNADLPMLPEVDDEEASQPKLSLEEALDTLVNDHDPLRAAMIYSLSDLDAEGQSKLMQIWGSIPTNRRLKLMRTLADTLETNFEMDFSAVTKIALTDLDEEVREAALDSVWIDESADMFQRLMPLVNIDTSTAVRAAAASALGNFILQGELGKFSKFLSRQAENALIQLYRKHHEPIEVRRRALEAVSNCSREEVNELIADAYRQEDTAMRSSAIFAMGRSCDAQWEPIILHELRSQDPALRYEAVRAAGELELQAAVPLLGRILDEEDREIMEVAIWALGEIGGDEAMRQLGLLSAKVEAWDDDDLNEAIEEAIASASLSSGDLFGGIDA